MTIKPLTMEEAYSLNLNGPANLLDNNSLSQPASAKAAKNVPDFLLGFAQPDQWDCLILDDVLKSTVPYSAKNLYLDHIQAKSTDLNTIFEHIRKTLSSDKYFAFKIVTAENIKQQLQADYPEAIFPMYYFCHFLSRRVLPKVKGLRKLSRQLSIPVDRSRAEIMGRLIYSGYKIVDLVDTPSSTVFVTTIDTENNPSQSNPASNEGFLFKMKRVGKDGKEITVYKLRSMHPYAEYVQEYLHRKNGLEEGGKIRNDFRVSTGGRLIRKYWIDELPMMYNLLRGDIKLVGIRPISKQYFALYPPQIQDLRVLQKPGLLPPFYADLPKTFDEIIQSEVDYMNRYAKEPVKTDIIYLFRILKNIIIKSARSK